MKDVYHFVMPARMSNGEMERKGVSDVPMANHFTQLLKEEQNVRNSSDVVFTKGQWLCIEDYFQE